MQASTEQAKAPRQDEPRSELERIKSEARSLAEKDRIARFAEADRRLNQIRAELRVQLVPVFEAVGGQFRQRYIWVDATKEQDAEHD